MQRKSLRQHLQHHHAKQARTADEQEVEEEAEGVFECAMGMGNRERAPCPIPGCGVNITRRYGMQRHFMYRHPYAAVYFPGEAPLQECQECGLKVPKLAEHRGNRLCRKAQERREKRTMEEKNRTADWVEFSVNGTGIEKVGSFKYLGRILSEDDNDWPAIRANIQKARQRWGQIARILAREGASTKVMGYFYKAIVQAVLLYAAETWVVTERSMKALNSFHHRCARHIAGDHIRQNPNGEWHLPAMDRVLEVSGLLTVEAYITKRVDKMRTLMEGRPIFDQCLASTPSPNNVNQKVWW
jgi:hypothetical protein